MNPATQHAHEDRLLELAYGELAPADAAAVQHHLQGCERCSDALASIRGVRTAMAPLAEEVAPVEGLESLLAYAEQAAKRNAESTGPPRPLVAALVGRAVDGLRPGAGGDGGPARAGAGRAGEHRRPHGRVTARRRPGGRTRSPRPRSRGLRGRAAAGGRGDRRRRRTLEKERVGGDELRLAEARPEASSAAVEQKRSKREAAKSLTFGDTSTRADWSNAGAGQRAELLKGDESPSAKPRAPAAAAPSKVAAQLPEAPATRGPASAWSAPRPPRRRPRSRTAPGRAGSAWTRRGRSAPRPRSALRTRFRAPKVAAAKQDPSASPAEPVMATGSAPRQGKAAAPAAPPPEVEDPKRLSSQAAEARADGDRAREAILLQRALAAGATGSLRAELLSRSCEVEDLLGRAASADAVCARLLQEFPGSSAAGVAQRRRARQLSEEAGGQPAGQKR